MAQFWQFCWFIVQRFERNENRRNAAELTFVTLFAVVPLMTSGYVMLTWFPQYADFIQNLHDFVFLHFVPASGQAIQSYLGEFSQQARKLTWIGLIILIFSAFSLMLTIEKSFNNIWRVKNKRVGRRLVFYWFVIFLGPLLLGAGFLISSYLLSSTLWLEHVDSVFHVNQTLFKLLPLLLAIITLTAMYYFLPSTRVSAGHALLGGVFSASVLELCKSAFVSLVSMSPSYQLVYGAFAVVPLFLIWVFLAWCVVLLGAELVRGMPFIHKEIKGIQASDLDWALMILQAMKLSSKNKIISREQLAQSLNLVNINDWERVIGVFMEEGWIAEAEDGFYLDVSLDEKTVGELSDIIHEKRFSQFAVVNENTAWFGVLKPILVDMREQKKAALKLPISKVIQY